jgi:hypothetical protein
MATLFVFKRHLHKKYKTQLTGTALAGSNCTPASGAMGGFTQTNGKRDLSPDTVRKATGDTSGGTNLDQIKFALARLGIAGWWGPYRGMSIQSFWNNLRINHRAAVVQGASSATRGTKYQGSETFGGNHAWAIIQGRGWFKPAGSTQYLPTDLLVGDPLCNGRRPGIAKGFQWIPRRYVVEFFRRLDIGGRQLGYGKVYALLTKDTWPHYHLKYGAVTTTPRNVRVKAGYKIRSSPGGKVVRSTTGATGMQVWMVVTDGPLLGGSRKWYGNHEGNRWIHSSARA